MPEIKIAIALKHEARLMPVPIVVAKGKNLIAERIVEIAKAHNIPIVENKPLAEALYRTIETGGEIRTEFYEAVAEVLAFVRKLKRK